MLSCLCVWRVCLGFSLLCYYKPKHMEWKLRERTYIHFCLYNLLVYWKFNHKTVRHTCIPCLPVVFCFGYFHYNIHVYNARVVFASMRAHIGVVSMALYWSCLISLSKNPIESPFHKVLHMLISENMLVCMRVLSYMWGILKWFVNLIN